ncbi:MAG: DUF262 domain-containing protein [Planctomycetaceae bacterium]|jgi:uncharacterized protein with ParB-like and HNH nuclease domain|nr:DUF262 domain-containing protein [Planctomycetaceae bacterium]
MEKQIDKIKPITKATIDVAEKQIERQRKIVDYDIKEYPIEVIVQKYSTIDEGTKQSEFYIPDYQRELTWDERRQSKFIESVLIGLPIPFLTLAETSDNDEGGLEIVDGSQRIRTLHRFLSGEMRLEKLEKLEQLNGFSYNDLPILRRRKFNRTTIRIIVLSKSADEETRRDIFERINTGSDPLKDMEQRRGIMDGPFLKFIEECANNSIFQKLAPISETSIKRREREEFVLRFFAYYERYKDFKRSVKDFLDDYAEEKRKISTQEQKRLKDIFERMLQFANQNYPNGFHRQNRNTTPRVRFEALAVGTALALDKKSEIKIQNTKWMEGEEFLELTTSDASNSHPKVCKRIEFVRDILLNNK